VIVCHFFFSYGILLWSILTGEKPYPSELHPSHTPTERSRSLRGEQTVTVLAYSLLVRLLVFTDAFSSLVRLRIPEGDRPTLEAIDPGQAEGLGPLVELMGRCWHSVPQERPSFLGRAASCLPPASEGDGWATYEPIGNTVNLPAVTKIKTIEYIISHSFL